MKIEKPESQEKGGRPFIDPLYKKTKTLQIKMNAEEYKILIPIAKKLGQGSISEGVRRALRIAGKYEY